MGKWLFRIICVVIIIFMINKFGLIKSLEKTVTINAPNYEMGTGVVDTQDPTNKTLKFDYYLPSTIKKSLKTPHKVLVLVGGVNANGTELMLPMVKDYAEKERIILLGPSFICNNDDFEKGISYQYPKAWSGDALVRIINKLNQAGIKTTKKLDLIGFSAGAQFVLRFSLFKPYMVNAVSLNAFGGAEEPYEKTNVKYFITVGSDDAELRQQLAKEFYNKIKNLGITVFFKEYNVGHVLTYDQIYDSLTFFKTGKI